MTASQGEWLELHFWEVQSFHLKVTTPRWWLLGISCCAVWEMLICPVLASFSKGGLTFPWSYFSCWHHWSCKFADRQCPGETHLSFGIVYALLFLNSCKIHLTLLCIKCLLLKISVGWQNELSLTHLLRRHSHKRDSVLIAYNQMLPSSILFSHFGILDVTIGPLE